MAKDPAFLFYPGDWLGGTIDQPGDYELDSQSNVLNNVYSIVSGLATSGLGYIYEDAQGRIGYADSTHRGEYLRSQPVFR